MAEIKIENLVGKGVMATVIDGGEQYSTYEGFARAAGHLDAVSQCNPNLINAYQLQGEKVMVLAKGNHGTSGNTLYVCATPNGRKFIIGDPGLSIELPEFPTLKSATFEELLEELMERIKKDIEPGDVEAPTPTRELNRKDIVNQAKADIEELTRNGRDEDRVVSEGNATYQVHFYEPEFFINADKRTVVALIHHLSFNTSRQKPVARKGIAKCDPADCFNEHIGKAIALRRALGLRVPVAYLNAPQPEGKYVGDIVDSKIGPLELIDNDDRVQIRVTAHIGSICGENGRVINDTARY